MEIPGSRTMHQAFAACFLFLHVRLASNFVHISGLSFGFVNLIAIKILLSILTIFGAENRAKMTILGADFMQWPNLLH